jgi:MoaA/NifB/PqqE/SkfB family radical SAM enzyme
MTTLLVEPVPAARPIERPQDPYPQQLILDWTDYCNAKCFFCYREKYEQQIGGKGEFIPFAKLKRLEKVLSQVKVFGISSGIGEPLLHPELEQILRWLYDINPTILIRTTTNGTALTASKAPWFAGHLDWLSVSLNAANGEAHMRDMFPHLVKRGIDAQQRWELHLRHLKEFIAALPPEDRPRIRFQMVAHRYNVKDIPEFVRVVDSVGGSHAVITNIAAHAETIDWSLYWIKDLYNDCIEQACEVGTRLGVKVDAPRFYTSVKPVLDLDEVCHDPTDNAYISRASVGAPCCQWAEAGIPTDVYNDDEGFDRYWNHDILHRLRQKRNFQSCQVCGMSRVFDETSFHFSPHLKMDLINSGRLTQLSGENDFPDAGLVRACIESRLDLPSIRRTLLAVGLPVEMADAIGTQGLAALPALDQACWDAFQKVDLPLTGANVAMAGPFLGIGWGVPVHEHQNRISARWIGGAQQASIFARVQPGATCELSFTIHHIHPAELQSRMGVAVCGRALEVQTSRDVAGRTVLSATVPEDLTEACDGRLWVRIGCLAGGKTPKGHMSLVRLRLTGAAEAHAIKLEELVIEKDGQIAELGGRLNELEEQLKAVYSSRSWRVTTPLRALRARAIDATEIVRSSPLAGPLMKSPLARSLRKFKRWLYR